MGWFLLAMRKYAVFQGRSRCKEYWMFFLIILIIGIIVVIVESVLGLAPADDTGILTLLFQLIVLVPSIAVGIRRMHDTDHRGWWLLFPIVNLVLAVKDGQRNENRFGPDPKASAP